MLGGRDVGAVGVEEVDEEEVGRLGGRQPLERGPDRRPRPAVQALEGGVVPDRAGIAPVLLHRRAGLREAGVVDVEALSPAEARIQDEARHEGGGRVARRPHRLRQGRGVRGQVDTVARHAVPERLEPREERRVARRRLRGRCIGLLEEHALAGEALEGGRRDRSAVGRERVGAQRVDRDEQQARPHVDRRPFTGEQAEREGADGGHRPDADAAVGVRGRGHVCSRIRPSCATEAPSRPSSV